ncbi:hypothetical protein GF407_14350 [candidate division KSB1 bacterium]|nr:hypothetical protein [candidate division KSB1 bacterium]
MKGKEDTIRSINYRMGRGKQLLTMAEKTARMIRHLPFIRGIYISGDLSKGVATTDSDIDFFIISAPQRVYLSKLFLALFRRIFFLNPKKLLCFNYILDERHLELDDKNHFVAMEIAYLRMLYNQDLFDKFLAANGWVTEFVPRYRSVHAGVNKLYLKKSKIQGIVELFFNNPVGKFLDRSLMYLWRYSCSVKYRKHDSIRNSFMNGTQRSFCKIHDSNRKVRILDQYNKRMHKMGLTQVVIKTG